MSLADAIAVAFLAVSGLSLAVQAWALHSLRIGRVRGGVIRTAWCRVGCAVVYVLVGINALTLHRATLQTTFVAFCITQGTWQANAWLDVRQGRAQRPRRGYSPRHRSSNRLQETR